MWNNVSVSNLRTLLNFLTFFNIKFSRSTVTGLISDSIHFHPAHTKNTISYTEIQILFIYLDTSPSKFIFLKADFYIKDSSKWSHDKFQM